MTYPIKSKKKETCSTQDHNKNHEGRKQRTYPTKYDRKPHVQQKVKVNDMSNKGRKQMTCPMKSKQRDISNKGSKQNNMSNNGQNKEHS